MTVVIAIIAPISFVSATLDFPFGDNDTILTNDQGDVIGDAITNSTDPIRDGTKLIWAPLGDQDNGDNIYFDEWIDSTQSAWVRWTRFIKWLLNWALWITGLVALIYLIYHGILAVTAWTSDEQYQKGIGWVRFAFFALAGIAVSWFVISLVFWLINLLTW